ncbi:hypothetical protein, conserved [Trypanosoma brucei brucei TREU927]|uniref:Flagellar attachment zone protein 1 n=1 Tax=Trypanosoma brucei brucei (strain 927/4 GUTat10.1) TaxID=185431 RepID=FAZ1_TRYB2|nr:hypothetical protein, conserved [Trypanosoma brucei brucei TREU927]Q585H6.1 RecName: Full=Flagellar attachment zone protein 1 [Trypanosoma brucei brucei TREU927]AAX79229.1 hypothetical protein, conserved [Trypanosoma brucei]AAZ10965.1 hypothetical protein, conserved [Trypanosoma brucei brucei TREU927]
MALLNVISENPLTLQPGQVIAFDHLANGEHWQWALGTVVSSDKHVVVVEQWAVNEGSCETLKHNISSEIQKEMKRMGVFQEQLSSARDKLAAIRSENEDRVSAARAVFEDAKARVASVDEVHMREVTSQACPSPVAVEVLKSVLALAQNDPTVTNCSTWDDIRMEYRRPNAIADFISADITGKTYPNAEEICSSLNEQRLSSLAASRDSEAISSLHHWVLSALAYQEAYCRLTTDTRVQEQNDAIANCIAGMKGCRLKVMKLKEELERGGTPTFGGQLTSFTKTSVQLKAPLSSVISIVGVDPSAQDCVLTDDEVGLILDKAEQTRLQINDHFSHLSNSYMEAMAELHCLSMYTSELEERRLNLQERFVFSLFTNAGKTNAPRRERIETDVGLRSVEAPRGDSANNIKDLQEIIKELSSHDERWMYRNEPTVTTKHRKSYPGREWSKVVERKPEELLSTFRTEQAAACHVPEDAIRNIEFTATSEKLQVSFDVQHPVKQTAAEINKRLQEFPSRGMDRMLCDVDQPKKGLDRAIVEVCRAFDLREHAFRGMTFDKFIEEVAMKGRVGDKDAYESEIGDLLMLLDKIHNENRSLQYTLEKSAEEFRRQTASTMREQESLRQRNGELHAEIGRLRDLVEKLRDLADNQASELELLKLQKTQANQIRAQRNLSTFRGDDTAEPVYCVTLDELREQTEHCDQVERELERQREQCQNLLNAQDDLLAELSGVSEEKEKLEAECERLEAELRQMEEKSRLSEQGLSEMTQRLEEKQAEIEGLLENLEQLDEQLEALRAAEKSAQAHIEARDREISDLQQRLEGEIDDHIKTTALLEELRKHYNNLEELFDKQEAELMAYREKRQNAHKVRSLEPTLRPIGTQTKPFQEMVSADEISSEPLLSVTLDEYNDHMHRSNQFQQENDLLRQQLQQANDERENLHDRLEQLMAENQSLSEQLHNMHEELEREERDRSGVTLQNERLAEEIQRKTAENEQLVLENNKSRSDIRNLNVQVQRLMEELELKAAENEKLAEELELKAAENEKLAEELELKVAENEKLAEELELKVAENEKLAEELELKAAENEKLAEELELKAAENEKLAEELELKAAENEKLAEELELKAAENEKLAEELELKAAENEKLAEELELKAAENEKLAEELELKAAENEKLAEELELKVAENEKLAEELELKAAENEKLAEELELKVAENEKLAEELELKAAENEKLAEELELKAAENEKLAEELELKAAENEKLAEELELKAAENEKLAEELELKVAENEKLAEELELKAAENEKLAEELELKVAENEKLAEELELKAAENEKLAEELELKVAENEKLAEELELKAAENEKLAEELELKVAENEKLAEELELKAAENEKLAEELELKAAENEKLAEELELKAAENEKLAEELELKAAENEKLAEELELKAAENEKLAEELELKVAENEKLAEELELKAAENEKLAEELELKVAENEKLAEELELKAAENEKLAEELELKAAENEKLAEELELKAAENEKLAEELELKVAENKRLAEEVTQRLSEKELLAEDTSARLLEADSANSALQCKVKHLEEKLTLLSSEKETALATLEAEIVDLLTQLKGLNGTNSALESLCASKEKELVFLREHCELWTDPTTKKEKVITRHVKVFDGNEWMKLITDRPEALMSAFVIDAGNACHVPGDQIHEVSFLNNKEKH